MCKTQLSKKVLSEAFSVVDWDSSKKKAFRVMVRGCDPKGGVVRVYGTSLQFYKLSILWNERPPFGLSFNFGLFFARISRNEQDSLEKNYRYIRNRCWAPVPATSESDQHTFVLLDMIKRAFMTIRIAVSITKDIITFAFVGSLLC